MKSVSARDLVKAVERQGWVLLRVHGSHHIYGREGSTVRLSIPMHEGRESLYKALSSGGNPELGTVQKVVRSLGLRLHVTS